MTCSCSNDAIVHTSGIADDPHLHLGLYGQVRLTVHAHPEVAKS